MAQMKAGDHYFPVSISVLENDSMEFLFGLDNLKRHQARQGGGGAVPWPRSRGRRAGAAARPAAPPVPPLPRTAR